MNLPLGEAILRLGAAAVLSGIIGFEREVAQKAAGLRTHMLVGVGAALFSLLSVEAFAGGDPGRVAAQVVTGIGFLGAGAIFRHGFTVRGLTTAAGLWTVAAVGMAAGIGEWQVAVLATAVVVVVLYVLVVVQWLVRGRHDEASVLIAVRMNDPTLVEQASATARGIVEPIGEMRIHEVGEGRAVFHVTVEPSNADATMVRLRTLPGVERVSRME